MEIAKDFVGQEIDPLTGLYYYHSRYSDPVGGVAVMLPVAFLGCPKETQGLSLPRMSGWENLKNLAFQSAVL